MYSNVIPDDFRSTDPARTGLLSVPLNVPQPGAPPFAVMVEVNHPARPHVSAPRADLTAGVVVIRRFETLTFKLPE
jgi:hypothetical protein